MAVPTFLQQSDAGAPTLTGEDGSLYNVLKWALPQLGWSVSYDNSTDKIAFQNAGSGYYLQVTDAAADHADDARRAKIDGYATMSALDTGTGQFPAAERYWLKSETLDATARDYFILGTDEFFYFGSFNEDTNRSLGYRIFWAGDFVPISGTDPGTFTIGSQIFNGNNGNNLATPIQTVIKGYDSTVGGDELITDAFAVNFNDSSVGQDMAIMSSQGVAGVGGTTAEPGTEGVYPDEVTNSLNTSRMYVCAEAPLASGQWPRRGTLPGILDPLASVEYQSGSPFSNLETISGLSNGNTQTDLMLVFGSWYFGNSNSFGGKQAFLFDITTDWSNW